MVADAPTLAEVLPSFYEFVSDSILVGWNVSFDINFLYDNCERYLSEQLSNDYIDVMRIARKELPELPHHRLIDIAQHYHIQVDREHRAYDDCVTCNECYRLLREQIVSRGERLDDYHANHFKRHYRYRSRDKVKASDIVGDESLNDPDHPLYGKVCVFTGTLEKLPRAEAMKLVADIGGIPEDRVTKRTNYLILGNNDYCSLIKDGNL